MTQNQTSDGNGGIAKRDMLADILIRAAEPEDAPGATALMNLGDKQDVFVQTLQISGR